MVLSPGPVRQTKPAEVRDVLTLRELAVDVSTRAFLGHHAPDTKLGEGERTRLHLLALLVLRVNHGVIRLLHDHRGSRVELLRIPGLPPVVHVPVGVVLASLVVEPVRDLVADDGADGAEVNRGIGAGVEKRRLQNRRREHDLVEHGVVVGVDLLRRHEPALAIHGRVDARQHARVLEPLRREAVGVVRRVRDNFQLIVVGPDIRVADLDAEARHLLQRLCLCRVAHPRQLAQPILHGVAHALDEPHGGVFRVFRKVSLDVLLSDEFTDGAVGLRHHPLPPGLEFLLAVEFLAEEGEVLVDKVVGEGGRRGARAVKGCVREHIFFVNRGSNQGVGRRDERVRPRYVQLAGLSLAQRFEVHAPGKRVVVWQ